MWKTLGGYKKAIYEAFGRFKLTLYPLTGQAKVDIEAAELIQRTWMILSEFNDSWLEHEQQLRVGFFDGGPTRQSWIGWKWQCHSGIRPDGRAFQDSVGSGNSSGITKHYQQFSGVHRIPRIHIVGDSNLILNFMKKWRSPAARPLIH
ncbi:hypothetical protein GQ600_22979 [Phytophthora cactorum]|nr:hypothetical protein GQ600_22979 [Phytophthora cactorum]